MNFPPALATPEGLVHAPLAHWAAVRPTQLAIAAPDRTLDFETLQAAVAHCAAGLNTVAAPATVLVNAEQPAMQQLIEFLGIVASGRCAAVADADWPAPVQQAVQALLQGSTCQMPAPQADTAFYTGFTSGSSGMPKGFRRHHRSWTESFRICLQTFGEAAGGRILVTGSLGHSLFLFGALLGLWSGAGIQLQTPFSAQSVLEQLRRQPADCLVAVPSQLLLMLELAALRQMAPLPGLRLILISGARWPRQHSAALRRLFPDARVIEFYGASELSFVAWTEADANLPDSLVGQPFANVELQIRSLPGAASGEQNGMIWVRSPMLFDGYVGPAADASACLRDGDWLSVRDMGHLDAEGRLCLVGRQSRMIVTRAKKLFPEELEDVLQAHPAIARASVHGVFDDLRGQSVVAIVCWKVAAPESRPTAAELTRWCRARVQAFKLPRRYFLCQNWPQTASGKTDHQALAQQLASLNKPAGGAEAACLQKLS